MSSEFLRKYPRTNDCPYCGRPFTRKGIGQHMRACRKRIPGRLAQVADQLERGEPVTATQIERHETPDGPMHTATKVQL